jgi:GT2 family glycosyltransferase
MEGLPTATIHFDLVDGYDTAIATIPARAGFQASDVLVSFGQQSLAIGALGSMGDFLARDNPRQKLAAVAFSGTPEKGECLLIGARGLVAIDADIRLHADIEAFHAAHAGDNDDMIAILARSDEEAAPLLNLLERRDAFNPQIDQPSLSFRFVLEAVIALENGLFANGWFHDPEDRIESVVAVDHSLADPWVSAVWKTSDGQADVFGKIRPGKRFAAFLPRAGAGLLPARVPLRVILKNGESHLVTAEPVPQDLVSQRDHILDYMTGRAVDAELFEQVLVPALGPIQDQLNARQSVRHVREFGPRSRRSVSIVIPLYREIGFIRSQLAAFAVDPYIRKHCEIVYVLDDPLIASQVESVLEGSVFVFPLDLKLVTLDRNGGYALANNVGVSQAEGETLILMNSDVVPDSSNWITATLKRLDRLPAFSVIGPKLLYADGSLQHAGMYFYRLSTGFWQNFHYWKGYGRHFGPADRERSVPAVTGACMIIRKADYLAVGGFTTDYITGDYEDSDLCLKLRDRNGICLYMPSIELYHFERQSMPDDADRRDRGSTIYNRALHSARWSDRIVALMAEHKEAADVV